MNCPRCHSELQKEFYHKFICFRCPDCGGRLMTVGGLRNLSADRTFADRLWKTVRYDKPEPGETPCSSCGEVMRKATLPLRGIDLELDVCVKCQTVWFDPAELERIPLYEPPKPDELPPEMKEKIALARLQLESDRINEIYHSAERSSPNAPDEGWQYLAALLGFPVENDAPEVRTTPWITWGLAATCVLVFLLTCWHPGIIKEWGFIPAEWQRNGGLTFLTSMFLHGGIGHLIGNLYFLLVFGDNAEDETGKIGYVLLILFSGLCALSLHSMLDPRSTIPCIGASGFISGVIAFYAVSFPKVKLTFLLGWGWLRSGLWLPVPAWAAFALWLILQGIMAFTSKGADGGGTAYLAHLGGALPGLFAGFLLRVWKHGQERRP